MSISHITVLILAAGFSTRMQAFKPLLPLGGERSILSKVAGLWQRCGVQDILVVTGHRAEEVEAEAARCGCGSVRNPHPEGGMFSSVQCGLRHLLHRAAQDGETKPGWCAVHPVDIPLIREETIRSLCARTDTCTADCLLPCHAGRCGHPPLLQDRVLAAIAGYEAGGGLRAAMQHLAKETCEVADPWLNTDLDRSEDYKRAQALLAGTGKPLADRH